VLRGLALWPAHRPRAILGPVESPPALDAEMYAHLRALAARVSVGQASGAVVQPTELLHEAWVKLARSSSSYKNRDHFIAVAVQAMRQILVDQARARLTQKRGAGACRTTVSGLLDGAPGMDLLELDDLLTKLAAIDGAAAQAALLRIFGGLTVEEVAVTTGSSERTVARKWRFARAFLEEAVARAD